MIKAKFKINDDVLLKRKTLYNEDKGVIVEIQKAYKELEKGGLLIMERDIKGITLPYTFENDVLTIEYPQMDFGNFILKACTRTYYFSGYEYVVKTEKMNTVFSEKSLKKI